MPEIFFNIMARYLDQKPLAKSFATNVGTLIAKQDIKDEEAEICWYREEELYIT